MADINITHVVSFVLYQIKILSSLSKIVDIVKFFALFLSQHLNKDCAYMYEGNGNARVLTAGPCKRVDVIVFIYFLNALEVLMSSAQEELIYFFF